MQKHQEVILTSITANAKMLNILHLFPHDVVSEAQNTLNNVSELQSLVVNFLQPH